MSKRLKNRVSTGSPGRCRVISRALNAEDAKDYVFALCERGELLLARPLKEQLQAALERFGFHKVRIDHQKIHDIWLVRASVGTNLDCTNARIARNYLHRVARSVGKRLVRGIVHPELVRGRIRCALLFTDARSQPDAVELDPGAVGQMDG